MNRFPALLLCSLLTAFAVGCTERTFIEQQDPPAASNDDPGTDPSLGVEGDFKIPSGNVHALQIASDTCGSCGPLPNPWSPDPPTSGPLPNPWAQKDNGDGTPNTDPTPPPTSGSSGNGGNSHKN